MAVFGLFLGLALGGVVRAAGTYVIDENFNGMAVGGPPTSPWIVDSSGGPTTVQAYPFAPDLSVAIQKPIPTAVSSLSQTFADLSGRIVIEAKVRAAQTAGFKGAPYIYNRSGATVASVSFQNGSILARVGSTATTVQSFNANEWYLVRVVVDTTTNTFDLYIDGIRKLTRAALRTNSASLNQVRFYMDGTNTGTLMVDNVAVYPESAVVDAAPTPIFDVRSFGAIGNGVANDGPAIQAAIDACTGTGGSVYLSGGTFLSGTLRLKSNLTFFIDSSATLLGSQADTDYPKQTPPTNNNQLGNCQKALLYAESASNVKIDGGGTIDGNGNNANWTNSSLPEYSRPISIWTVLCNNVTMQNIYIKASAMWTVVNMETDNLLVKNLQLNVNLSPNRDGIDTVDCHNVVIRDCTVFTGDDAICFKSGIRRGVDNVLVQNCNVTHTGTNGLKFGTASYGGFTNVFFQDCYVKHGKYAAMAVESKNGAFVDTISFNRVQFEDFGNAYFVFLGQQPGHPRGDVDKFGSMNHVEFVDTLGWTNNVWGTLITGHLYNGTTYYINNLSFTNCNVAYKGGLTTVPADPPEWNSVQYTESNLFGNLPAWGYYVRHVNGVTFTNCSATVSPADARPEKAFNDVNLVADTTPPEITVPADLIVEASGPTGASVSFAVSAMDAVSGPVAATATPASGSVFPLGSTLVTVTARDAVGNVATKAFSVKVVDTTPPTLTVPADQTIEATGADGAVATFAATATDTVSTPTIAYSSASGSTFAIGTTTVIVTATDEAGNTATGKFTITVRDTTAPTIHGLTPSPTVLWPANHKMVAVTIAADVTDNVGVASVKIVGVTSSEPDNGAGDGNTSSDIEITGPLTLNLRAERSGTGNGRVYTITVEARDAAGNACTKTVTITVPKSQGGK